MSYELAAESVFHGSLGGLGQRSRLTPEKWTSRRSSPGCAVCVDVDEG